MFTFNTAEISTTGQFNADVGTIVLVEIRRLLTSLTLAFLTRCRGFCGGRPFSRNRIVRFCSIPAGNLITLTSAAAPQANSSDV